MSTDAALRELLVRQLDHWLPGALHRSRRATLALGYAGDPGTAEAALRVVAEFADQLRGRRLTVLVLAGGGPDLPARLGPVEATLPADVAVHVVPGDPSRLPVALKAAGAAGAPLLTVADGADPAPAMLAAAVTGRPAELLLTAEAPTAFRAALTTAGFRLTAEAELVAADGSPARTVAFGTNLDNSLAAFKDALWDVDESVAVRYRDPAGAPLDLVPHPDPELLRRELLAELNRGGPRTVTELRRHTTLATAHRAADTVAALTDLLRTGTVRRDPVDGRLGGDVVISAATGR
ncbi:hypothetical protein [Micromonospora sp. KC213]|uniref:hypothetical protein n=1 Tax=Micromonospora sp. KC213 TaxID=2530378 RepID=UPI0010465241|nr:hypothetical protein [Micromonospora sp. KC213]TDC42467.1 hypothetical protein E1166_07840 [Micromonospora sp. KC213]